MAAKNWRIQIPERGQQ